MPSKRPDIADINPYASPAVADGPVVPDREIGAYQDGPLLVVHSQARLPEVCFKTGQPATRRHTMYLDGSTGTLFGKRTLSLDLPLSHRAWWLHVRIPFWLGMTALLCLSLGCTLAWLNWWLREPGIGKLMLASLISAVMFGIATAIAKECLVVKRVRGDWFWISGAHPRFLDRLPPWLGDE
jgi:hypothetical protein